MLSSRSLLICELCGAISKARNMKKIFIIDWVLIPAFILSAAAGIGLHNAGHGNNHEVWHNWAVAHILSSLLVQKPVSEQTWKEKSCHRHRIHSIHGCFPDSLFPLGSRRDQFRHRAVALPHRFAICSLVRRTYTIQRNKNYVNFFQQGTMPILTGKHFPCRDLFLASACFPIRTGMFSDFCA